MSRDRDKEFIVTLTQSFKVRAETADEAASRLQRAIESDRDEEMEDFPVVNTYISVDRDIVRRPVDRREEHRSVEDKRDTPTKQLSMSEFWWGKRRG